MNFITPDFRNLILIFKTDTSSKFHGSTAGTFHTAVRGYFFIMCILPSAFKKLFRYADINEIPWEDLIQITLSHRVKIGIDTTFRKSVLPSLVVKVFAPRIKNAAFFINF